MSSEKILNIAIQAALLTTLLQIPHVKSNSAPPIPEDLGQVNQWFNSVVKPHTEMKGSLDPPLAAAEAAPKVIKVRKDGSGDFDTITKAIASVPAGNTKRTIIWIGPGKYEEKITIDRGKPFITLYGSPNAVPTLVYSGTAAKYGTVDSATLIVMSDYFVAANLIIVNSATMPDGEKVGAQAVALRTSGDKQAFYNCRILGYQDTLCDDRGNHFFKDCYIEGTVDFIFGSGKSLYLGTQLHVLGAAGLRVITAQARELTSEDQGYSFVHCNITGVGKGAYLGRAWKSRPVVVFAYSNMGTVVNPTGWSDNFRPDRDSSVYFGEYKCKGEGSDLGKRVKYAKVLSDAAAQRFISLDFIGGNAWLRPPPKL